MDNTVLFRLGYGLYVLTAQDGGRDSGCIINTVLQVTTSPLVGVITVNKQNYTHEMINKSKKFNVSVLTTETPFEIFTRFGFQSGGTVNKFADFDYAARSKNGILYLTKYTNAYLSFEVTEIIDFGTHSMFKANIKDGEAVSKTESVTYSYYQQYIKPKPQSVRKNGYRCNICGYVHEGDILPDDFICPICKHGATDFIKIINTSKGEMKMKKFICSICGYVHEGLEAPEHCPQCKAPASKFNEQSDKSMVFADEHRIGVAKDVAPEIIEGLRQNFMGECTEVGMYLAMSRQADREGYPEVAEAYKRIAYEEAEHAAKFAELLGEVVDVSTKKNLEMRVMAEHGATQGKKDLATKAKQLNLDAIHDTVHEMCKDEARHGMAFQGLLKRYF